jgi:hypothetical protein
LHFGGVESGLGDLVEEAMEVSLILFGLGMRFYPLDGIIDLDDLGKVAKINIP